MEDLRQRRGAKRKNPKNVHMKKLTGEVMDTELPGNHYEHRRKTGATSISYAVGTSRDPSNLLCSGHCIAPCRGSQRARTLVCYPRRASDSYPHGVIAFQSTTDGAEYATAVL
ncbi:hypothetical protein P7K49_035197 [Saguinus oedipus]|uniref:Uncharacterized protein n=1 Tax=Saguinus oedipus TaxID=9490 RepID=A0ABQ9TXS2_SAGOE|nr:hypothetical protein P7K49_035197 [Saguinus oedipus]